MCHCPKLSYCHIWSAGDCQHIMCVRWGKTYDTYFWTRLSVTCDACDGLLVFYSHHGPHISLSSSKKSGGLNKGLKQWPVTEVFGSPGHWCFALISSHSLWVVEGLPFSSPWSHLATSRVKYDYPNCDGLGLVLLSHITRFWYKVLSLCMILTYSPFLWCLIAISKWRYSCHQRHACCWDTSATGTSCTMEFYVHSCILAATSLVFHDLFTLSQPWKRQTRSLVFQDECMIHLPHLQARH